MIARICGVFALVGVLGGCAAVEGYPKRVDVSEQYLTEVSEYLSPTRVTEYGAEPDALRREVLRNDIVTARLYAIDVNFHEFERSLTKQQNIGTLGADWAIIGLGGAGTLVSSAATKTALAAASTVVAGGKAAVDKDVYYTKTIPALLTQMEAQRKLVRVNILTGLQKPTSEYTLFQALADLDAYYSAGTLNAAVVGLTATAGAESKKGDEKIAEVTTNTYSYDAAAEKLYAFWMSSDANAKKLSDWMTRNGVTVSAPSFIRGAQYAAKRKKAVKALIK